MNLMIYQVVNLAPGIHKNILNRCLNVCFLLHVRFVCEFLFRMIRSFIIEPTDFVRFPHFCGQLTVLAEFIHQFRNEFEFHAELQVTISDHFNFDVEHVPVLHCLDTLEAQYPILQYVSSSSLILTMGVPDLV